MKKVSIVFLLFGIILIFFILTLTAMEQQGRAHAKQQDYAPKILEEKEEKYERVIAKDIAYGKEKEKVGIVSEKDHPRLGPESFANDIEGNLYICDGVNRRIQVFSSNGEYRFSIPLQKGMIANDIAIDKAGMIYVYDAQGKLHQFSRKGNFVRSITVDVARLKIRMGMHVVDGNIYISNTDQEDVLIGRITNGSLTGLSTEEVSRSPDKGIHAPSGKRYFVKLIRGEKGIIEIIEADEVPIKYIDLPLEGIASIKFLEEDQEGNFYIQIERYENNRLFLEVHKFDTDGNHLTVIPIPEIDYHSWTIKLLSVDGNGNIYQFMPGKETARLNVFKPEQK